MPEPKRCSCCEKHTLRAQEEKKKLLNRLRRIEGQVRGLQAMVEADAYCNDVLTQSAAVNAAINAFNREVDEGITAFIGDVITSNTIAVAGEANAVNMPMITASATAEAVTVNPDDGSVYTNVFRTCFIDPFQGEKMAQYAKEKLGYTKA